MFFKVTINILIFKKLKIKDEVEGVGPLSDPKVTQSCVPVRPTLNMAPQRQPLSSSPSQRDLTHERQLTDACPVPLEGTEGHLQLQAAPEGCGRSRRAGVA